MIDLHYDLLSILYYCYLKEDFNYLEEIKRRLSSSGVTHIVCNLYFMNEEEMKREMGDKYQKISVLDMFKISTSLFHQHFPNLNAIFSIEGCDYIKDEKELEELYKLGLRNILLVWNNQNKYGSGNRSDSGLTNKGINFLKKAIDLGISIDLSHMNHNTFNDTLKLLKEEKKKNKDIKVIVSHSNCYSICPNLRNLTDEQIISLKELNPLIGIVSYGPFVSSSTNIQVLKEKYVEHIKHIISLLGDDCVAVSTDDMKYDYELLGNSDDIQVFPYQNIKTELKELLSKNNICNINKIMYENSYNKLFRRN